MSISNERIAELAREFCEAQDVLCDKPCADPIPTKPPCPCAQWLHDVRKFAREIEAETYVTVVKTVVGAAV